MLGLFPDASGDHPGFYHFELRHSFDDHRSVFFPDSVRVDAICSEHHALELGQLREFSHLVPVFDSVIRGEKGVQLGAVGEAVERRDLIVGNPKLLEGLADVVEARDLLDLVSADGEYPDVLEFG